MYRHALILALITIFYNILEGVVSVFFGIEDDTIALCGFGIDSFVEVASGIGVAHMVSRLRNAGDVTPDRFEKIALRITGGGFYVLTAALVITSVFRIVQMQAPETTVWGVVVSVISIVTMSFLYRYKLQVGRLLSSQAILADASCTRTCLYLSGVLLLSSAGYELTGIGGLDAAGALGIAWYAFREGKETFEKARGGSCGCCSGHCNR